MKRKSLFFFLMLLTLGATSAKAQTTYHSYTASSGTAGQSGQNYGKLVDNYDTGSKGVSPSFSSAYIESYSQDATYMANFEKTCDPITVFPWKEDFEGYPKGGFSDPCWVNEHYEGSVGNKKFNVSTSTVDNNSTHTLYVPMSTASGGIMKTKLVLPQMTIPSSGTYVFSIDVRRNASTNNYSEGIRVFASTDGNIEGAIELGFISRSYTTADADHGIPAESAAGWHTYTLPIPITGTCRIVLLGESTYYGGVIYMDNFKVDVLWTKTIEAYESDRDNYYLIASPVGTVTPSSNNGFLSGTYNLYYFDQNGMDDDVLNEWRNYSSSPFNIESGKGYLYASKNGTTLTFTGTPYGGNGQVTLSKTNGARFSGWNLVGNPFAQNAYIDGRPFYIINPAGRAEIIPAADVERNYVEPMEGIFVIANSDEETLTFTTDEPEMSAQAFNVSLTKADIKANKLIDRAIVRFDECHGLPKFQLNPNHTKLYIPQSDKDYAVVHTQAEGELPLNLKVEENGRYTLSVDIEKVSFDYLHLIDNMTGADIDLLATPTYTFDARTTNYASRFKLVFAATGIEENGASTGLATFAYYNGSEWNIANNGEATLQVIDIMGRVLSSQVINGNTSINLNQSAGVYMLRLVDGNSVRTQKVIVK